MLTAVLSSLLLIALCTVVHYEALHWMFRLLPALKIPNRTKLFVVIFGAMTAHFVEIAFYGVALYLLADVDKVGTLTGAFKTTLENCMYFSAETFTSLGFGDVTPVGPLRLVCGVEALNGLLLIGWSASFTYIAMEKFWTADRSEARP